MSVGLDPNIKNADGREGNTSLDSDRVLVLYFSETGNTQKLANLISNEVGGDFRRIEPVTPYPTGDALFDYTEDEADNNERPEFKDLDINMDDYDTVFIGYPIWWYDMPMIIYSFFDEYDFTGKTVIPFCTSSSSGIGESGDLLADEAGTGNWLEGHRFISNPSDSDIKTWIDSL